MAACVLSMRSASAGPAAIFDVTEFGATGDGETLATTAIQSAIDTCAEHGGGTVRFLAGAYLTGTIFLKDHVRLEVGPGARVLGSTNVDDYPPMINGFPSRTDRYCVRALIRGEGLHNVAITGPGVIDGQGPAFRDYRPSAEEMAKLAGLFEGTGRYLPNEVFVNRPYLIQLVSCRDVVVENIHLRNSAMWMQHYLDCEFVTIRGVKVFNHGCRNNDMLDIDCCRNVIIADCYGDTDDDGLTLKSTGPRATENVVISNCILRSRCNALKAGTESSGGFKNITITNCVIQKSSQPEGLTGRAEGLAGIALEIVDGGTLDRVAISNITIEDTSAPIFMRIGNRARPHTKDAPQPPVGTFRNVTISNIVATCAGNTGCTIAGIPGHPIQDVSISNVRIAFNGAGNERAVADVPELEQNYPECIMFGDLPAYGFFCRHVDGITFRDVSVSYESPDARPALVCDDVRRLNVDGFQASTAPDALAAFVLSNTQDALIRGCRAPETAPFLKLENHSAGITVAGNDLSRTTRPFVLDPSVPESALHATGN
jgi:polygalacturonase